MASKAKKTAKKTAKLNPAVMRAPQDNVGCDQQTMDKPVQQEIPEVFLPRHSDYDLEAAVQKVEDEVREEYSFPRLFEKASERLETLRERHQYMQEQLKEVAKEILVVETQLQAYRTILNSGLHGALTL